MYCFIQLATLPDSEVEKSNCFGSAWVFLLLYRDMNCKKVRSYIVVCISSLRHLPEILRDVMGHTGICLLFLHCKVLLTAGGCLFISSYLQFSCMLQCLQSREAGGKRATLA